MQLIDIASFSVIIASVSVVIGVVLALLQFRQQSIARQAQVFTEIFHDFSDTELIQNYCSIVPLLQHSEENEKEELNKRFLSDTALFSKWLSSAIFFEGVGVLVRRKMVDVNLMADLLSTAVIMFWELSKEHILEFRKSTGRFQYMEYIEYLHDKFMKIPSRRTQTVS